MAFQRHNWCEDPTTCVDFATIETQRLVWDAYITAFPDTQLQQRSPVDGPDGTSIYTRTCKRALIHITIFIDVNKFTTATHALLRCLLDVDVFTFFIMFIMVTRCFMFS